MALLLSPLDLANLWNPFSRIRIIMGKFGCTQIRTSSSCSARKKKDLSNFGGGLTYLAQRFNQLFDKNPKKNRGVLSKGRLNLWANYSEPNKQIAKIMSPLGATRAWSSNLCAAEFPHYNFDPINRFHKFPRSRGPNSSGALLITCVSVSLASSVQMFGNLVAIPLVDRWTRNITMCSHDDVSWSWCSWSWSWWRRS